MSEDFDVPSYNAGFQAGQRWVVEEELKIPLRDQFAMAALTAILKFPDFHKNYDYASVEAFKYADAMLEARKGKEG